MIMSAAWTEIFGVIKKTFNIKSIPKKYRELISYKYKEIHKLEKKIAQLKEEIEYLKTCKN